ncbi:MAG: hypothetical protein A2V70_21185 [Planctomycetes bacterium RBG_13_63_9]|nr:MAG: hypothetical protein A2V70_21185 [Planctomycetes bacterium RBG_13_63_9]
MGAEWYVDVKGRAKGPFTATQLRTLALENRISGETRVRQGADGRWVAASRVKGLFEAKDPQADGGAEHGEVAANNRDQPSPETEPLALVPDRRVKPRLIVLACLVALALIATVGWPQKVFFCTSMVFLLGTFPRYCINGQRFEREFVFMFVRVQNKSWRLASFEAIETDLEFQLPAWTIIFLFLNWFLVRLLDYLVPWAGGKYRILLRDGEGERILAWQGNGEGSFRANLQALEDTTGLPVERR